MTHAERQFLCPHWPKALAIPLITLPICPPPMFDPCEAHLSLCAPSLPVRGMRLPAARAPHCMFDCFVGRHMSRCHRHSRALSPSCPVPCHPVGSQM